jgi:hypothetical protein
MLTAVEFYRRLASLDAGSNRSQLGDSANEADLNGN